MGEDSEVLTVCSLPDILGSSKSVLARAKGETAAIVVGVEGAQS